MDASGHYKLICPYNAHSLNHNFNRGAVKHCFKLVGDVLHVHGALRSEALDVTSCKQQVSRGKWESWGLTLGVLVLELRIRVACLDFFKAHTCCLKHVTVTCSKQQTSTHTPTRCGLTDDASVDAVGADHRQLWFDLSTATLSLY